MSERVADRFETQAARYLYRTILMEEEHRPLPEHPSPDVLMERVREHVESVDELIDDYERGGCEIADILAVAVQFMWLGASAITAAVHMDAEGTYAPTALKDHLLGLIDKHVNESIGRWDGEALCPRELLEPCSYSLFEATECLEVCDPSEDDLGDAVDSLWNVAYSAAIAVAQIDRRRGRG
jgi:hypothetical protein